jgi:hypothetical protein
MSLNRRTLLAASAILAMPHVARAATVTDGAGRVAQHLGPEEALDRRLARRGERERHALAFGAPHLDLRGREVTRQTADAELVRTGFHSQCLPCC